MKDPFGGGTSPLPEEDPRWEEPVDTTGEDPLGPSRGCLVGLALALVIWVTLAAIYYLATHH